MYPEPFRQIEWTFGRIRDTIQFGKQIDCSESDYRHNVRDMIKSICSIWLEDEEYGLADAAREAGLKF